MSSGAYDLGKVNQRLRRHWTWLGIFAALFLLVLGSVTSSLVRDMGGLDHVRKVGVLTALAQGMTDSLVGAFRHRPEAKGKHWTMTTAVVHLALFVVLAALIEGRASAVNRLRRLREKMELLA